MSTVFLTMRGLTTVCPSGLVLTYLVLFSFISLTTAVTFDLTELRNKVAKIKVNPRGNLWATGHFMGKKSVMDNPLLPSSDDEDGNEEEEDDDDDVSRENYLLGNLFQEVLRVGLKAQPDSRSKSQETGLLMKILLNYIQSSRM